MIWRQSKRAPASAALALLAALAIPGNAAHAGSASAAPLTAGKVVAPLPGAGETVTLCYSIDWSGFQIARLRYQFTGGDRFEVNITTDTVGLVKLFGPLHYAAMTQGRMAVGDMPRPVRYAAAYTRSNKERRVIELFFDQRTGAIVEDIRPPRGYVRVKPEERRGALDPLTATLFMRPQIIKAVNERRFGSEFRVPVYDGSKRYDVITRLVGPDTKMVGGQRKPVYHLVARIIPVAGFKPDQVALLPKKRSHFYVGHDEFFVPVDVSVALNFGQGGAKLTHAIRGAAKCPRPVYKEPENRIGH